VVNSAFYGLPRQIGSINRAVVLLGLNAVKNIAIAASLTKLFRGGELCPQFSARDLWIHSIATATASKLIVDRMKLGLPDEAFLAGLIHDIGIMVEVQTMRDKLLQVFAQLKLDEQGVPQADMRELERRICGADHCAFGSGLCDTWKFPRSFTFVAGHHHEPQKLPDASRILTAVVYVADRVAARAGMGFRGDLLATDVDTAVLDMLRMTPVDVENIRAALPEMYEQVEATFR
jgi:HD-like signal output (HDOD) protein